MRRGIGLGFGLVLGALLGAGMMFVLDPERGRRRRLVARIQAKRKSQKLQAMGGRMMSRSRDLRNRVRGRVIEAQAAMRETMVPDEILVERIRSRIGHFSDHPRNILVTVKEGMVTVGGPILAREVDAVIRCVQGVRGVRGVTNCLEVYRDAGSLPALQE
ncbi:hypothetical protein D3C87_911890 [compost metagenome]